MKTCTKCDQTKELSEFYKNKNYKDGHKNECKDCTAEYNRQRYQTAEVKDAMRDSAFKIKYGISLQDYNLMYEQQNGSCKICGSTDPQRGNKHFMVDHDHTTGKVRGLLCAPCNMGLGLLGDNISTLQNAINYLNNATHHPQD